MAYAAYIVMAIGVGRAKRTQFNWVITGCAAVVNVALNLILVPPYGMMGAAVATVAAYVVMFVGHDVVRAARLPDAVPVAARAAQRSAPRSLLLLAGKALDVPSPSRSRLRSPIPLVLLPLGFYLPAERLRLRRAVPWRT